MDERQRVSDDEEDMEEEEVLPRGRRDRLPLHMHHFLRILAGAGAGVADLQPATSNEDLVNALRRVGVVKTQSVYDALRVCARDLFVPARHRQEAFIDTPIRLDEYDFNISAPHMHATCLEALDIQPGNRVLDVGSGCGVLTAAMAMLAGPSGVAVGIDIKQAAVTMGSSNVEHLCMTNQQFATSAAPCTFYLHNVFMPSNQHHASYDRIHVGASCPPHKLPALVDLLGPSGGVIVVPVHPSDLRCIVKHADGNITQRILSQVRYGDLEVPTEAQILAASIEMERQAKVSRPLPPSTFMQDISLIFDTLQFPPGGFSPCSPMAGMTMSTLSTQYGLTGNTSSHTTGVPTAASGGVFSTATTAGGGVFSAPPPPATTGCYYPSTIITTPSAAAMCSPSSSMSSASHMDAAGTLLSDTNTPRDANTPRSGQGSGMSGGAVVGVHPNSNPGEQKSTLGAKMSRLFSACSKGKGGSVGQLVRSMSTSSSSEASGENHLHHQLLSVVRTAFIGAHDDGQGPRAVTTEFLGAPDAVLRGVDWEIVVHSAVLRARCALFRARSDSGMRDATHHVLHCPDHFAQPAAAAFLHYLYTDTLDEDLDIQLTIEVLHMATYYSVTRLVSLCEERLAGGLQEADAHDPGACHAACTLLAMADELGLSHVRSVALDFIVHNFGAVSVTEAYGQLSKGLMQQVAMEAAVSYSRVHQLVRSMSDKRDLPEPSLH